MLELCMLFETDSETSSSFMPNVLNFGTPQNETKSSIHFTNSATVASSLPKHALATSSYRRKPSFALCGFSSITRVSNNFTFIFTQCGNNAAQIAPCGACSKPPSVPLNPCTAPNLAFANAIPPYMAHNAISVLAFISSGCSKHLRKLFAPNLIPLMLKLSVTGFGELHTYGSMHCVRASNPVCAVTSLGICTVNFGSTMTKSGNING